ncbi:hypothetical protein L1987_15716 [Smallanthus sonchifolius]|uniref:Uncharacterized protein n=1 Tax=Smallanthus sonchifolius TaxID=185202 RepID=A0ACB9J8J6_9ASTR|nr:hypothetical protein L1987_15716 [Smallanthus sonchifolius]
MDKENLFDFPHESDDEVVAGLTRRFSRSASLQQPHFHFKEKRVFSGSPEPTLGRSDRFPAPSPPASVKPDEDAWNLIYAAAAQVAQMKMSNRGVIGAPHAFEHPWGRGDGEELFRRQHFSRNRCVAAWPPPQVQNQRHQQIHTNLHKLVVPGRSGTAAKRECAGTGVFLPRGYCTNPPESRKRQARMIQPSNKTFVPISAPPEIQPRINTSFISHYEMLTSRRKAMISAGQPQRSNIRGGVMNNPEALLPQEWTY